LRRGPVDDSKRRCTDLLCCFIFVAFIGGCVVVTALGFAQGNPNLVLYPYDEDGRQCGRDNSTLNYPYLYFYAAVSNLKDYNVTGVAQGVCVSTCPSNFTGTLNCISTKKNPKCAVSIFDFYVSTPCKFLKYFSRT
jgi:choline transporter-like protein 2/4/5